MISVVWLTAWIHIHSWISLTKWVVKCVTGEVSNSQREGRSGTSINQLCHGAQGNSKLLSKQVISNPKLDPACQSSSHKAGLPLPLSLLWELSTLDPIFKANLLKRGLGNDYLPVTSLARTIQLCKSWRDPPYRYSTGPCLPNCTVIILW